MRSTGRDRSACREDARAEFVTRVEARLARLGVAHLTASFVGFLTVGKLVA